VALDLGDVGEAAFFFCRRKSEEREKEKRVSFFLSSKFRPSTTPTKIKKTRKRFKKRL